MLQVKNWAGESVGEVSLNLTTAKEKSARDLVYRAVVRQLANARQGTACSKTRSEVRGGGRKPWRQKGTGRARAGSTRSPLWRGGGVIFGPRPRDFSINMNKKERRLAIRTALMSRLEDVLVVESFQDNLPQPKTKEMAQALERWGVAPKQKTLLILHESFDNISLSSRNIANLISIQASQLNIVDILNAEKIVVTQEALKLIERIYEGAKSTDPLVQEEVLETEDLQEAPIPTDYSPEVEVALSEEEAIGSKEEEEVIDSEEEEITSSDEDDSEEEEITSSDEDDSEEEEITSSDEDDSEEEGEE